MNYRPLGAVALGGELEGDVGAGRGHNVEVA